MKRILLTLPFFLVLNVVANDIKEGKELYLEANCQKCHLQDSKFDPNSINKDGLTSKVKNKKDIHKWVESCDNYFNIGWFPKEIDKVTEYLNTIFYKLK